ncbi:MAG: lysophospholipid acyltransferase family protein [Pseudomonadota bacterium]
MPFMSNRLISIAFLAYMAATSALFFLVAVVIRLITGPFDRRLVILHQFTSFWACLYLWTMPAWSVRLEGREKITHPGPYVIVSNHQSQLDILVAFRLFFPFKWVSKIEVFRLPFIGWNMTLNRYIPLKRGDKESIAKMLTACEAAIAKGSSVYFFPEGTRSKTGVLKAFKPGAFLTAKKMQVPILAIAINGTHRALPKHSLVIQGRHAIRLSVLEEIPYAAFQDLSAEETAAMVREKIAAHVDAPK